MLWYKLKWRSRLNVLLSFSVSPAILRGLSVGTLLNIWVTQSITAEMYLHVSNGSGTWAAWLDREMSGCTVKKRAERVGENKKSGERGQTIMHMNHILLKSQSGNFHLYRVTLSIPTFTCHHSSSPPEWLFCLFIHVLFLLMPFFVEHWYHVNMKITSLVPHASFLLHYIAEWNSLSQFPNE